MSVESAEDRASFFSADEFATPARYAAPAGVAGDVIMVIHDRGAARNRFEAGEVRGSTQERRAWINRSDVALVERGGTLEVGTLDDLGVFTVTETLMIANQPKLDETGFCWSADLVLDD